MHETTHGVKTDDDGMQDRARSTHQLDAELDVLRVSRHLCAKRNQSVNVESRRMSRALACAHHVGRIDVLQIVIQAPLQRVQIVAQTLRRAANRKAQDREIHASQEGSHAPKERAFCRLLLARQELLQDLAHVQGRNA